MQSAKILLILSICLGIGYSMSVNKKAKEDCPQYCPELFEPVCASNGDERRVFANNCELEAFNCWEANRDFSVLSSGQCDEKVPLLENILEDLPKDCPPCTKIYLPVCGVDESGETRTFANECEVDFVNCDESKDYRMLRDGEC